MSAFNDARLRKGLSLAEITRAIGVSRTAVIKWDRGLSYPRREVALRLAELLEIDADELQRPSTSHYADPATPELVPDILSDAREKLASALGVPPARVRLTLAIDA